MSKYGSMVYLGLVVGAVAGIAGLIESPVLRGLACLAVVLFPLAAIHALSPEEVNE